MDRRYVDHAISCVTRERRWTAAEEQAFEAFARRVQDADVRDATGTADSRPDVPAQSLLTGAEQSASSAPRAQLRTAYAETVLETTAHRHAHDESPAESLAAEFGPEIAAGVLQTDPLTPALQSAVLRAAEQARDERTRVLDLFDRELDSLTRANDHLVEVDATVTELADAAVETWQRENLTDAWDRLLSLELECESLAQRRQAVLRERSGTSEAVMDALGVVEYLYRTCPFTYPVLAATAEYVDRLRDDRRRIADVMANGRPIPADARER